MNWLKFIPFLLAVTIVVECSESYTVSKVGTSVGSLQQRSTPSHKRDETNTNGNTNITHSFVVHESSTMSTSDSYTISEGGPYYATIEDDANSCQYTIIWRFRSAGQIYVTSWCVDLDCIISVFQCISLETTYNVACWEVLEDCGTQTGRDATGQWSEDPNSLAIVSMNQRQIERGFLRRDPGDACTDDCVPFNENDIQYAVDPGDDVIPSRLFSISTFGLNPFPTSEPKMSTIQARFSLTRNQICNCELGFSVNGIVDEASVVKANIDVPYDIKTVVMVYSKILPASPINDIALAYRCTPAPGVADVQFAGGTPSISVDLVSLYPSN